MDETTLDSTAGTAPVAAWQRSLFGPVTCGLLLTAGFYAVIHYWASHPLLVRYFCSHPLEYVLAGLFWTGTAILAGRWLTLRSQRAGAALAPQQLIDAGETTDPVRRAEQLSVRLAEMPRSRRRSPVVKRLREAADFVLSRRSSQGLDEHLRYLAEESSIRLAESYTLLQTIVWAIPIIGFLGTVMGITLAIAGVTPDQLENSLSTVTGGLAVAFDTTAVALSLSLVLGFLYATVRRQEEAELAVAERTAARDVAPLLADAAQSPVLAAEQLVAERLLDQADALVERHAQQWDAALNSLQTAWQQAAQSQQQRLATLLEETIEQAGGRQQERIAQAGEQLSQLMETSIAAADRHQQERQSQVDEQIRQTGELFRNLQQQFAAAVEASIGQQQHLAAHTEQITSLHTQANRLADVENRLADNLETLNAAATIEDAVHQLTAAVHLLTTRTRPHAA